MHTVICFLAFWFWLFSFAYRKRVKGLLDSLLWLKKKVSFCVPSLKETNNNQTKNPFFSHTATSPPSDVRSLCVCVYFHSLNAKWGNE